MGRNRGIHRPHAPHDPMPFTTETVWTALVALTGEARQSPATADEIAQHIRDAHPRRNNNTTVTHNDLIRVRKELDGLVQAERAELGCERPNDTGRRPRQFMVSRPRPESIDA